MLRLRPYQRQAIDGLYAYWREEPGNPLIVLPTGAGKSLVMATLARELVEGWPDMRLACVTHVRELIAQNYAELVGIWPWAPAGIYSAGLGRRESTAQILFCGIQSVFRYAERIGHVDVLMVDEAHLIPGKAATAYQQFIAGLRVINPDMKIVGLTATPFRLDSGRLDQGDDRLFDRVAYEVSIRQLIDDGYLSPLASKATATVLDVSGVAKRGGEFVPGALEAAINLSHVTRKAVDEIISLSGGRKCWLLFCAGVAHAYAVRDELRRRGIQAETVEGGMPTGERDRVIGAFREGRIQALTNANVLTTGFNVPQVDLLAMLRPTMSTSLYVQMVGRASRKAPGKRNALVLDFAGNVARHGPIDDVRARLPGDGQGDAPVKICPSCAEIVHASRMVCPDCGHEFESAAPEDKHTAHASDAPIMSTQLPEWVRVSVRSFLRHEKPGSPDSVRVDYLCGLTTHREWWCPEHKGFAREKFERQWREHGGATPFPASVADVMARQSELRRTDEIRIRPSGRYFEIVGRRVQAPSEVAA